MRIMYELLQLIWSMLFFLLVEDRKHSGAVWASRVGLAGGCSERALNRGGPLPDLLYEVRSRDINLQRESHAEGTKSCSAAKRCHQKRPHGWVPQRLHPKASPKPPYMVQDVLKRY